MQQALIAGGGIGGLAAALACARANWQVRLFERAEQFAEVGAGIQLAPNATQVLHHWGLRDALARVAYVPQQLLLRDACSSRQLAHLPLGQTTLQRYGAHHVTLHRADLQALLLQAVQQHSHVKLKLNCQIQSLTQTEQGITVRAYDDLEVAGDLLVGADGVHSQVRQLLLADGPAQLSGHVAYRALVEQSSLPLNLRCADITVWLGPHWHVVHYPVRDGQWLNVVAIVHTNADAVAEQDDANTNDLRAALHGACTPLQDLLQAITQWRQWPLYMRAPLQSADELAQGCVALLGDAAHPMLPHLGQGAGMALEDALELGRVLQMKALTPDLMLRRYALNRWQRNARVQMQSVRNGRRFHVQGPARWGRAVVLRLLGSRLLDQPWLYRGVVN